MTHDSNMNPVSAKLPTVAAEPSTNICETNPTAETCMIPAQVATLHLCFRCGQPVPSEFCPACGHRYCLTCGE